MTLDLSLLTLPRFSQPENWRWHSFKSSSGHKIRFGSVFPKGKIPDAVVVCLPGFREFGEKYFELANDMLSRNLAFWVIDWVGQGGSDRLLDDPFKVHSLGFEQNIKDLKQFIFDYVKPAAVHPDVGRLPTVLIGHSMGAHIGLRYLHENTEDFIRAAAFSAPLISITQFSKYPSFLIEFICECLRMRPTAYIPGGEVIAEENRKGPPGTSRYTSDPARDQIHRLWFDKSPVLQVKGPTYSWLYETVRSCNILRRKSYLEKIKTPIMIATAGQDIVVSSKATEKLVSNLPDAELLDLPDANHEILMERDEIRNRFLTYFDDFLQRKVLSRQDRLKKF